MLDFNVDQVFPFVRSLVPGLPRFDGMTGIGLRKDGELVAGVIYEGFNGPNVWMHVAAVVAESYPVTFKLYADGVLKHTQTVASEIGRAHV